MCRESLRRLLLFRKLHAIGCYRAPRYLKVKKKADISCVDLFCGAGGLSHGFVLEQIKVAAGVDLDADCRVPFETNNGAKFIQRDVAKLAASELDALFGGAKRTILAGCAPCQPFSTYAQRYRPDKTDERWGLLKQFARLAKQVKPDIVTMENVPTLSRQKIFRDFVRALERDGYCVWYRVVDSSEYGVPQSRMRLVLLASKHGAISLLPPTHKKPLTVRDAIGKMMPLKAGEQSSKDPLHAASALSPLNLRRIRASRPGGTWRDWPKKLVAECHKSASGRKYPAVYGRMEWDKPAPTMTTQCYGFGNGRFGHPEQDRGISLREAALLQSFPKGYQFLADGESVKFTGLGRLIGNAVPVNLGRAIARSIKSHFAYLSRMNPQAQ